MPVASGRRGGSRQLLILAFATIAAFVAMYFLFSRAGELAGSGEIDVNLGSEVFEAGQVVDTADFIADQGPWLMPDLIAGRDRDIILQHLGDDPETGWHAFAARPAAAPRDCFLEWNASDETFTDNCDGTTYDAIGTGLTQYPVLIDANGNLAIDINASDRPPSDGSDVESVENTGNDGG